MLCSGEASCVDGVVVESGCGDDTLTQTVLMITRANQVLIPSFACNKIHLPLNKNIS